MDDLLHALATALRAGGKTMATAESCTGGMIAAACTSLAGSSLWFERGVVSYSNEAKAELLGVDMDLIKAHGAVSEPVARSMAGGLLARAPVDYTVAVTGIAGPDGGSADKPVGTVWLALAGRSGVQRAWREQFGGDRAQVREATVVSALQALLAQARLEAGS
nr:CinA family protein [uncultured Roseateles sp.]